MSRKVGVITLHNSPNYGSCLQTYATQVVLARVGADAEIIDYYRKDAIPENEVDRALNGQLVKKMPIFKVPGVKQIAKIPVSRMVARRRAPLDEFRHSKLALTERSYYSADELDANPPVVDIYCTGSDQVWNSIWNNGFDRAFYLSFAPEGKKKIAYAASIGKATLEDWEAEPMRKALSSYSCISVREQEAADLLDSIGVHGAMPVIDPTLMLNRDDWEAIADGWISPEPYILVYQSTVMPSSILMYKESPRRLVSRLCELRTVCMRSVLARMLLSVLPWEGSFLCSLGPKLSLRTRSMELPIP